MQSDRPTDPSAYFEEESAWDHYAGNPFIEERTRLVREMLPAGVGSLIDVGCGNGALLSGLGPGIVALGLDPSRTALRSFQGRRVAAAGERLPIRRGAADAVSCFEVLEHLSDRSLQECVFEIARVARRWILVGAPDREDPMRNALRCPRCGCIFNRNHHLQFFDEDRLAGLFPDFVVRVRLRAGPPVRPYPRVLLALRHRLARRFYGGPGETRGLCPACGNREFPPFRHNLVSICLDGAARLFHRRRPAWILLLLERHQGGSIGGGR